MIFTFHTNFDHKLIIVQINLRIYISIHINAYISLLLPIVFTLFVYLPKQKRTNARRTQMHNE